jgi:hypothetical protein
MNSDERLRAPERPIVPGEAYIDYGPPLPDKYGILTIRALVRDPRCVFVYWEWPSPEAGRPWAVRLRDVDAGPFTDKNLDLASVGLGTFHFEAAPDRAYEADLGWIDGGRFTIVRTSNRVRTPRDRPSTEVDPEWAPGPGEAEMLGGFAGEVFVQGSLHLRTWGPSHA